MTRFHFSVVIVPQRAAGARSPVWQQMRSAARPATTPLFGRPDRTDINRAFGASACCSGCASANASICMQVLKILRTVGYGSRSQPYSIFALTRCGTRQISAMVGASPQQNRPVRGSFESMFSIVRVPDSSQCRTQSINVSSSRPSSCWRYLRTRGTTYGCASTATTCASARTCARMCVCR
jgi:hypothetical protein